MTKGLETEWSILVALFKATQEQQAMLIGQPKREAKQVFNRWMKEGDRLLKIIEAGSDEDYLEEITERIENSVSGLRVDIKEQL